MVKFDAEKNESDLRKNDNFMINNAIVNINFDLNIIEFMDQVIEKLNLMHNIKQDILHSVNWMDKNKRIFINIKQIPIFCF